MKGIILFLAAGLGIQYGWQQRDDGAVEYIIQLDEAGLAALQDGLPLSSAVPPELSRVDRVRIQVGNSEMPRGPIVETRPASAEQQRLTADQSAEENQASAGQFAPEKIDLASFSSVPIESISENADALPVKAADTAPQLVQTYWTNKQNQWNTAPTSLPPTSQPPPVIPVITQQSTGGFQTVRNSTLSQNSGFPTNRTADASIQQSQPQAQTQLQNQSNQQQPFNQQADPRAIGTYDPTRYPTQPGLESNATLDSRQGTITFGGQSNGYQNNFSAQTNGARFNNLDGSLKSNQMNDLEAVTPRYSLPPNPAYPAIPQIPNSAFNSQQNSQLSGGQINPNGLYQTSQTYPQQPVYPPTIPPVVTNNPYPSPNPYASPYTVYGQLPFGNTNAYADPYVRTRSDATSREDVAELRKEFKDALAELSKRNEVVPNTTPASRSEQIGQNLALVAEKPVNNSPNWTIAILTMLVSIGANFYLAWIALSFYHRYRTLAEDMRDMNRFEPH